MTRLLVIRHGETDWNARALMQGRADRPLTDAGRAWFRTARIPPGWEHAACRSSPLQRAMETARLLRLTPLPDDRLIEMDWGTWEGRRLSDLRAELGQAMEENEARGLDFRPDGGESPREVQARLRPLLASLAGPTIFVTHKGVLRALYALATGWTMKAKQPDRLNNGCAHAFEVDSAGALSVSELNIPLRPAS